MDALIKEYWQQLLGVVALTLAFARLSARINSEQDARIAADNRIEQGVKTNHEHHQEQTVSLTKSMEAMALAQAETVKSLHKVELTLTEIAAYEKGRTDELAKRGHDD